MFKTEKLSCAQYNWCSSAGKKNLKVIPAISFLCAFIIIGWSVIRNVFYNYNVIIFDVNGPLKGNSILYALMPFICTVLYSIFSSDEHEDRFVSAYNPIST